MAEDQLTITLEPPAHQGLDFQELKQAGIAHLQKLTGKIWTDYNEHDPGITILEQLCYAITDLSYRIDFELPDLLSAAGTYQQQGIWSPADILTINPVTLTDIRKALIDVPGVKNAWVEQVQFPQPEIYYSRERNSITTVKADDVDPLYLKGLYKVMIEKLESTDLDGTAILRKAKERLHSSRNLCEDFDQITLLEEQKVSVKAEIDIEAVEDPEALLAEVYYRIGRHISPNIQFYTLSEMLGKGYRIDEVFDGPLLNYGFIDTAELQRFTKKTVIRSSDIIQVIMDVPGVKAVKDITLVSGSKEEKWSLDLDTSKTPKFVPTTDPSVLLIGLMRDSLEVVVNSDTVSEQYLALRNQDLRRSIPEADKNIVLKAGSNREVQHYDSIQNHFPLTYGIGELGLPDSASPQRKAQARQLQGYLVFFEQILANYFAQLNSAGKLFSISNKELRTYFAQTLHGVPGMKDLINNSPDEASYRDLLNSLSETSKQANERKNRFLNHLMARFSEQFSDYSLLLYQKKYENNTRMSDKLVRDKRAFIESYPVMSANRGRGYDLTKSVWDSNNVSGMERRIGHLLGKQHVYRRSLSAAYQPYKQWFQEQLQHFEYDPANLDQLLEVSLFEQNYKVQAGTERLQIGYVANQGAGPYVALATSKDAYGVQQGKDEARKMIFNIQEQHYRLEGFHLVEHILLRPVDGDTMQGSTFLTQLGRQDPYSLQISFVFPDWPMRYRNPGFRKFILRTLREETPAHITYHVRWLNLEQMQAFEAGYRNWLNHMKAKRQ